MSILTTTRRKLNEVLEIYWLLVRLMVPIIIAAEILSRLGLIELLAPGFAPVMKIVGLPPELGLAWLSGMLVGIWGAVPLVFVLVPLSTLTTADITVFSALLLFAHGLPVEQKIIQKAGPGMVVTTLLRVAGGLLFAFLLHRFCAATGWLSTPAAPSWIPSNAAPDWTSFFLGLLKTLIAMFVILLTLSCVMELLDRIGLMALMMRALSPVLRLAGIKGEAERFTAVGLFLGISYGGGLLIREARSGNVSPRQVFISCAFMGFAHSIIEDTMIVVGLGADLSAVLIGRVIFAVVATGLLAAMLKLTSDRLFYGWMFHASDAHQGGKPAGALK